MLLRIVSDLHLDSDPSYHLSTIENEDSTVLVIAGDCFNGAWFSYEFFKELSNRFYKVLYIFGNHEYYNCSLLCQSSFIKKELSRLSNVFVLDNDIKIIDGITFIGTTLWSNILSRSWDEQQAIKYGINDFAKIKYLNDKYLTIDNYHKLHIDSLTWLRNTLYQKEKESKKIVVITHHAPSWQSVTEKYRGDFLNAAFVSNLDNLILKHQPLLWIHGHTHSSLNYYIGDTHIICNPKGYGEENISNFNDQFIIEV